ncbi:MAG: Flagellar biosynthesis protein FliR [Firmicutes bacterium]|nr:Flagellar biosynthesis protein FliR [Bacillota bacterium]MDI6704685.1 flagellar biosynthetic protein FliR [Bacillota bacterium]
MDNIVDLISTKLELFFLLMVRNSAIFLIAPVFGRKNVPAIFKIGLAFFMSIILLEIVDADIQPYGNVFGYAVLLFRETSVGFLIGFVSYVIFASIYIAGQIIDMETGFGVVNVLDPQNNIQVPIMGNYLYIISLIIFITIDGHHMLLSALFKSYELVPPGGVFAYTSSINDLIGITGETFVIGFKISAPVITAVFLTDMALGILSRTMPQMNVFIIGIPIKIIVGMVTLMIMIPVFSTILDSIFSNMGNSIFRVLTHLK